MGFPWVDVVGPTVTNTLAKECAVDITPGLFRLLNLYGEHMDAIVSSLSETTSSASTNDQTLDNLVEVMQAELTEFRDTRHDQELEIEQLDVVQQQETRTPVVHCKLKALPLLIIEVTRAYAAHRVLVNPSWKTSGTGHGKVLGRVQTAVNDVTAACKECKHQMSISRILDIWFSRGLETPLSKQRTAMPSEKSLSKVSQLSGRGDVYDLDTITSKGKSTSELSSYTSDGSCETAWTPSKKGSSRKRISACSRKTNYNYSRWSRKKRRDGPCATVSSPSGPRPSGQLFSDHPLELPTLSPCSGLGQCLRPVTNAELRASVNAALNTSDTSRRKAPQLEAYDRQTVSGQSSPLRRQFKRGAAGGMASTDSTKMVPTRGSKEANQCGPVSTNSRHGNEAILAVASNGDMRDTCGYDAKALDNKLAANVGGKGGDFEVLPLPSTAVGAVNMIKRGKYTLGNVRNLANGDGFEIDDILYELYAPSGSKGEAVQAPCGANDLEECIRILDCMEPRQIPIPTHLTGQD